MLDYSGQACLEHSNLLKVKYLIPTATNECQGRCSDGCRADSFAEAHESERQSFNYELFNCNNFNIRYWSWNYRGCWHQTCPPVDNRTGFYTDLIPITRQSPELLFLVTTSLN